MHTKRKHNNPELLSLRVAALNASDLLFRDHKLFRAHLLIAADKDNAVNARSKFARHQLHRSAVMDIVDALNETSIR